MPATIDALFSLNELNAHMHSGHVRLSRHPSRPLVIANYTSKAAFDATWNDVTRQCRGLIWNPETLEVIARPFPKFFDLYETREQPPQSPPVAHEKLDGSLGILYPTDGEWAVATRGSFESDQARWATCHLQARYPSIDVPAAVTPLVEIIYPENRIVVEHKRADLVLIGAIDIETSADVPLWEIDW